MILGRTRRGATAINLATDRVRGVDLTLGTPAHLSHLAVLVDGLGLNLGTTLLRGVIYETDDVLIARGEEVMVHDGDPEAWVQLPMGASAGMLLDAGNYRFGIHIGGVVGCARTFVDDPGIGGSWQVTDTYADGTADPLPAVTSLTASLPILASLFEPWIAPAVEDIQLSRLPWDLSQRALGATGVLRSSRTTGIAGWHGSILDTETGAVAIVRSDGPLAKLVGERIKVTREDSQVERTVYLFVHDEQAFPDELASEDLSLTRTAFVRLSPWCTDALEVTIEVLG